MLFGVMLIGMLVIIIGIIMFINCSHFADAIVALGLIMVVLSSVIMFLEINLNVDSKLSSEYMKVNATPYMIERDRTAYVGKDGYMTYLSGRPKDNLIFQKEIYYNSKGEEINFKWVLIEKNPNEYY